MNKKITFGNHLCNSGRQKTMDAKICRQKYETTTGYLHGL